MDNINKKDLLQGYAHIMEIIDDLLFLNCVPYRVVDNAPQTYKAMREFRDKNGTFGVYDGGDHGYLGKEYNIKFRALHDYMHYKYDLSFKFDDERQLSIITAAEFSKYAWDRLNLTAWQCFVIRRIISAEIKGQIDYFEENNEYVKDQTKFIDEYFELEV